MGITSNLFIYLLYFTQFPSSRCRHASCHEMRESRRSVKIKDEKRNFPLYTLKFWAWPQMDFRPSRASYSCCNLELWYLVKIKGSSSGQCPMQSPSQTPAIHSYHAPFSFLAWHPNPFFFKQSYTPSIHLFRGLPTERLPAYSPT